MTSDRTLEKIEKELDDLLSKYSPETRARMLADFSANNDPTKKQPLINEKRLLSCIAQHKNSQAKKKILALNNPNYVFANGDTLLFSAIERNNLVVAKFLLRHGANANMKNKNHDQETPLNMAIRNNDHKAFRRLISICDRNLNGRFGYTALMTAVSCGHNDFVKSLLRSESDARTCDNVGRNALEMAVSQQDEMMCKTLIDISPVYRTSEELSKGEASARIFSNPQLASVFSAINIQISTPKTTSPKTSPSRL